MNLTEKRRAERMLRDKFDAEIEALASWRNSDDPTPKPPATLVKKVQAVYDEVKAAGFEVNFYRDAPTITVSGSHPAIQKHRKAKAERSQALTERRDTLIRGVWAGSVEWPDIEKALA